MKFARALPFLVCSTLAADVRFEPNLGQAPKGAAYTALFPGGAALLTSNRVLLRQAGAIDGAIELAGARSAAAASGEERIPGVSHYLLGRDSSRWIWDVPRYAQVRFRSVYDGIDVVYHSAEGRIEFDFEIAPGANPSKIRLRFQHRVALSEGGVRAADVSLPKPNAWQMVDGSKVPVEVAFVQDDPKQASFRAGKYRSDIALTIDPIIVFATFLGGTDNELLTRVAPAADGAVYVAGSTYSPDFPASLPADDLLNRPVTFLQPAAYLARMKADGSALDWSVFIGGGGVQIVEDLKQDSLGNLYMLGTTTSANLPMTPGAYRPRILAGGADSFVMKFDPQSGRLRAASYLGVTANLNLTGAISARLAVDPAGGVYIAGTRVDSSLFRPTPGVLYSAPGGTVASFILRLNNTLTAAVYATYFNLGTIGTFEVDAAGNLVVGGGAAGNVTPVNPIPGINPPAVFQNQAFIAKVNATGTALVFASGLHGGDRTSGIIDIKIDPAGNIYVLGATSGTSFPSVNPVEFEPQPGNIPLDSSTAYPFLVKIPPQGGSLLQSTWFRSQEFFTRNFARLALQPNGVPCLAGIIRGSWISPGAIAIGTATLGSTLACLNESATQFSIRTVLPEGQYSDFAIAPDGTFVFTGQAYTSFKATSGAFQTTFGGGWYRSRDSYPSDSFVLRVSPLNPAPAIKLLNPADVILNTSPQQPQIIVHAYGSGFAMGMDVQVNGKTMETFVNSSESLRINAFSPDVLQPGTNRISITTPGPGGGSTEAILNAANPLPTAITVSPAIVPQGSGETRLVIRGANITRNSILHIDGEARTAQFAVELAPSGRLEIILSAAELAQAAAHEIVIVNPPPGGGSSQPARFLVQPPAGAAVPSLALQVSAAALVGQLPAGTKVTITGSNFTSTIRAFWDGQLTAVEFVSATRINVEIPPADLTRPRLHQVYVTSGAFSSNTISVVLARSVPVRMSAVDAVKQRLYVLSPPSFQGPVDLMTFSLEHGDLLGSLPSFMENPVAVTVSDDGQFLYAASFEGVIKRYNTGTETVDLEWRVQTPGATLIRVNALASPVGSPETVVAWTSFRGTTGGDFAILTIFDRDKARLLTTQTAGGSDPLLAGRSQIYLGGVGVNCWGAFPFDESGVLPRADSSGCEPPDGTVRAGGFSYWNYGGQAIPIAAPAGLATLGITIDAGRGRAYGAAASNLLEYDLESREIRTRAQLPTGLMSSIAYPTGSGALMAVGSGWISIVP